MELTPKTRKETFLAAAGGQNATTPTPITREEVFLDAIAKGGGGGSSLPSTETASAGDVLSLDDNKEPQWAAPSGGGGVLVVHQGEDEPYALDKTWKEIHDAWAAGAIVVLQANSDIMYMTYVEYSMITAKYAVGFFGYDAINRYSANAETDYPTLSE